MARALAVDVVFENHAGSHEVKKRREETGAPMGGGNVNTYIWKNVCLRGGEAHEEFQERS